LLLGGGGPKGKAAGGNFLQKIRNGVKLANEQSAPSACQIVICRSDRTFATTKAAGKILLGFIRVTH
jgi:hypothetical protein